MRKLIIICSVLMLISCSNPPARFEAGDIVCIKGLTERAIVKYNSHSAFIGYKYKVVFNSGNEVIFSHKSSVLLVGCDNAKQ